MIASRLPLISILATLGLVVSGCSTLNRVAVNKLGDALAGGGTVFASDDDPDLIKAASPFSLKLMESLLAESPEHPGLLLATASGFTQYAYAFVHEDADELEETNLSAATAMHTRARRLYLRARDYGLRGLEVAHVGLPAALRKNPTPPCKPPRKPMCHSSTGRLPPGPLPSRSPKTIPTWSVTCPLLRR